MALLKGIEDAKRSHSTVYDDKIKRTRLYVDEVQDYSQIEILLFFYIGGGKSTVILMIICNKKIISINSDYINSNVIFRSRGTFSRWRPCSECS